MDDKDEAVEVLELKPLTLCVNCSDCAIKLGFGFIGEDTLYCTLSGQEVEDGDACTMGTPGEPVQGAVPVEVDISNRVGYTEW